MYYGQIKLLSPFILQEWPRDTIQISNNAVLGGSGEDQVHRVAPPEGNNAWGNTQRRMCWIRNILNYMHAVASGSPLCLSSVFHAYQMHHYNLTHYNFKRMADELHLSSTPPEGVWGPQNFLHGKKSWSWWQCESEGVDYFEKLTTQSNDWVHQL